MDHSLYQHLIIDHSANPKNFKEDKTADKIIPGKNPVCGDFIVLYLSLNPADQSIKNISFTGHGCSICIASASLMTELMKGKQVEDALELFNGFINMLVDKNHQPIESLKKCNVLAGVQKYPLRIKCATLAWHALKQALSAEPNLTEVTTE